MAAILSWPQCIYAMAVATSPVDQLLWQRIWLSLTLKGLGIFFQNVILFS